VRKRKPMQSDSLNEGVTRVAHTAGEGTARDSAHREEATTIEPLESRTVAG